jgi:adenine-specific DNA-methyltransferase
VSVIDIPGKLGSLELAAILPRAKFPFPKPVPLLQQVVELTTNPGDLVLDPFVGSGTTAQAILALNAAHPKDKPRRWVCVEVEELIERTVTAPRLDKVISGYRPKGGDPVTGTGGAYTRWKLGEPFRTKAGALGKVSKRALASVLAAHHAAGTPYELHVDGASPLAAESDASLVYLYYGDVGGDFGSRELDQVVAANGGKDTYVYAERVLVDEQEAEDSGVIALQLPYDLPVPAV